MIKFDFKTFNNMTLDDYNLDKIKDKFLLENKMSGWYNLDNIDTTDIKKCAKTIRNKADVFIVPADNYEEAKQIVNKYNYKIKLIEAKNFNQVLEDLEKI